ncbi:hypothetical protein GO998_19765 (plasmid) [Ralstonia syzygii]|uniref:Restriction endonuclease type IV Mrr domain-containing protein n=2 Tax=Ralstonia solanacearum species complex TaxID=3116862 RepID=A0AAD0SA94_RALSL|nr:MULTISPECIES: restriction endonuclease [Ralstonia solanacearum species complex]AXV83626.1 hypothetical protein CJO77_18765 [Ralstonia solanacearum]AXW54758.1 hypothetical protein CJO92_18765 [Ralstonia solanacearum]QUP55966.1 hypothetical protein GO998_19765 [Ralstonia syzygii]
MITDWKNISPVLFEKLCAAVLQKTGFTNIQWYGEAGNDKGRDIIAERRDTPVPGVQRCERWMIQCKRYTKSSPGKSEIKELLDSALEHNIDALLIITTSTFSANLRDWLHVVSESYPFKSYIWEELDFRQQVNNHKLDLLDAIPELAGGKEPLWMYQIRQNEIRIGCNEFDEVEILVVNVDNIEQAKAKATEFLKHLRANGFEWWN